MSYSLRYDSLKDGLEITKCRSDAHNNLLINGSFTALYHTGRSKLYADTFSLAFPESPRIIQAELLQKNLPDVSN